MTEFESETEYKIRQAAYAVTGSIHRQPIFMYLLLIGLSFGLTFMINRQVSLMALFDGEGIFTVKEIVVQEEDNTLPEPTETLVVQSEDFVGSGSANDSDKVITREDVPEDIASGNSVSIIPSSDVGGGTILGDIDDGDWIAYTFTIPENQPMKYGLE